MSKVMLPLAAVGATLLLHGCGNPPEDVNGGTTPDYYSTLDPKEGTSTTTVTTTWRNANIWELRRDMRMGVQTTHDLSGNEAGHESLYEACWAAGGGVTTLAAGKKTFGYLEDWNDQFWEDGQSYGDYIGETGVNLKSKHNLSSHGSGCLMRKSRLPIDFTKIQRMEMDIQTHGDEGQPGGPWFSVWLSPLLTNTVKTPVSVALDAEIDIIENHGGGGGMWNPVNALHTQFSMCGNPGQPPSVAGLCENAHWPNVQASKMNHHFTVEVKGEGGSMVVSACGCPGTGTGKTCSSSEGANCATIKVGAGAHGENFRIWQPDFAGAWTGHYWLVADIWQTLDWDTQGHFQLTVDNVTFWKKDGKEWKMPLGGHFITDNRSLDPSVPSQYNDIAPDDDLVDDGQGGAPDFSV